MDAVTLAALPIFALVFSGYGARRLGLLGEPSIAGLNGFVYWFSLPALLLALTTARGAGQTRRRMPVRDTAHITSHQTPR